MTTALFLVGGGNVISRPIKTQWSFYHNCLQKIIYNKLIKLFSIILFIV